MAQDTATKDAASPSESDLTAQKAEKAGLVASHGIDLQHNTHIPRRRPPAINHVSNPTFDSPLRHYRRGQSTPREVKESLDARSEYVTSQDDGTAQHRINQYNIKQEIGRGSFGAVHLAVDQYGTEFAVKEFSKARLRKRAQSHVLRKPRLQRKQAVQKTGDDFNSPLHRSTGLDPSKDTNQPSSIELIREEIAIMKKLNHPNLCGLIEVLDDPREDSLYMVMEMCKKGIIMKVGLGQTSDPYSDAQCRCWFRDLILGIEYLHAQGILHRDIKPDNCLLTHDDVLKVVDFGVSEMFAKDSEMLTAKSTGSPAFLPPELCVIGHGDISGRSADIWSMGVTLYCLRYGKIPFEKAGILDLYDAIKSDHIQFLGEKDPDFLDMMQKIFQRDPRRRIKMHELREHPWVTKRGTDPLLSEAENTGAWIEPPTAIEMERAITGNIANLMTVMKAVRRFKKLTAFRRPPVMSSILAEGDSTRFTQPPLELRREERHTVHRRPVPKRSQSDCVFDRQATEGALVVEGVHKDLGLGVVLSPEMLDQRGGNTNSRHAETVYRPKPFSSPADSTEWFRNISPQRQDSGRSTEFDSENGDLVVFRPLDETHRARTLYESRRRGQARDPLEETLYLHIGPSTFSGIGYDPDRRGTFVPDSDDDAQLWVSESPGAADIDIYETAYGEEIERIRKRNVEQGKDPDEATVFLTRRVDERLVAVGKYAGKFMAMSEEGYERFDAITGWREKKARASDVSRALRDAARQEYEKRRQERRRKDKEEREKGRQEKTGTGAGTPSSPTGGELVRIDSREDNSTTTLASHSHNHRREGSQSWANLLNHGHPVVLAEKAAEKTKQAKGTIKNFVGHIKEKRTWSKDYQDPSAP